MELSGGKRGYVLKKRPGPYPETAQQSKLKRALAFCGIVKGITKAELQEKMINCLPKYFKEHKDGKNHDIHV